MGMTDKASDMVDEASDKLGGDDMKDKAADAADAAEDKADDAADAAKDKAQDMLG
jgi:hypothetical protein